jgi:palmitoyl-protein thioesterase
VVPRDSAWFSWFDGKRIVPLKEQMLWYEDRLGLKELDESGRLWFKSLPGQHMQFSFKELTEILDKHAARP